MAPLTKEQRSEAAKKAAATRRANREAAARREETNNNHSVMSWLPWVLLGLFILGMLIWHPWTGTPAPTATAEAPALVAVSCDTPSIKAGLTAADVEFGEYLDTNLGRRMTFTSRRLIVPAKAWNEVLTADELLAVETTWQSVRVCIPEGTFGRIFAGGFEQGTNRYENGVLMTLNPGLYEFKMRNGEVVIWYPNQENFANSDLIRIGTQIIHGNFDIHAQLAFFATTADLLPQMPADLVKQNNVQIVPFPEPVTE